METGLSKNKLISELTRSPHGDLAQYVPIATQAVNEDPNFYAHLIAWNDKRGTIRDAKVALPVLALTSPATIADAELADNALALIAGLNPRELLRAVNFAHGKSVPRRRLHRVIERRLRELEESPGRFERVALQHRESLHGLYARLHLKPAETVEKILFHRAKVGVFADVGNLANMAPDEIAGVIMRKRIPYLTAIGALGAKAKEPAVVQALIGAMSPTELVTNSKMLQRLGVNSNAALRAAYEAALQKAAKSKAATLKTTVAAEVIGGAQAEKLRGLQEKQMDLIAVEGDWLVLGDRSGSMSIAIETARHVAAFLARAAKGKVYLVFFNNTPECNDVTGMSYDEIVNLTKRVTASGGTSTGCGIEYLMNKGIEVDGIAIASDGGENAAPLFAPAYLDYAERYGKNVPVYFYHVKGSDRDVMTGNCNKAGVVMHEFDLTGGVDYYSLPNLIQTMRTNRYGLVDEILATPLLRLEDVFQMAA